AAEVEPGQRVLVGHGAREFERVVHGLVFVGVRVEPGAAERRAERGRVDGDDRAQSGGPVLAEDDLFMACWLVRGGEDAHGWLLRLWVDDRALWARSRRSGGVLPVRIRA